MSTENHAQPGTHVYTFTTRPGRQPQQFREFGPYADEDEAAQAFQRLFGYWPEAASHVRAYDNEASGDDRARRYAEALHSLHPDARLSCPKCRLRALAVMAVADAEQAALWTDNERYELEVERMAATISRVEALATAWQRASGVPVSFTLTDLAEASPAQRTLREAASDLRAALDGHS